MDERGGLRESWERTPSWIPGFRIATFIQTPRSLEALYHVLRLYRPRPGLERGFCCELPAPETWALPYPLARMLGPDTSLSALFSLQTLFCQNFTVVSL